MNCISFHKIRTPKVASIKEDNYISFDTKQTPKVISIKKDNYISFDRTKIPLEYSSKIFRNNEQEFKNKNSNESLNYNNKLKEDLFQDFLLIEKKKLPMDEFFIL